MLETDSGSFKTGDTAQGLDRVTYTQTTKKVETQSRAH